MAAVHLTTPEYDPKTGRTEAKMLDGRSIVMTGTFHADYVEQALTLLAECAHQAPHDLCGEQREFYCPRLTQALVLLGTVFPGAWLTAMEQGRDAYGEPLVSKD